MKILVTNDDGIQADGLRILAYGLSKVAEVIAVAPHVERSVIGTALTLRHPLKVERVEPIAPGVASYQVEGTPGDSVILALGELAGGNIDVVFSGINRGLNLGDDVLISGTVSAALQGHLHGLPAVAVSAAPDSAVTVLEFAASLSALIAGRIDAGILPRDIFLNVNVPNIPVTRLKGISLTHLASKSNRFSVNREPASEHTCYKITYHRVGMNMNNNTDISAIEKGNASITPLHASLDSDHPLNIHDSIIQDIFREIVSG